MKLTLKREAEGTYRVFDGASRTAYTVERNDNEGPRSPIHWLTRRDGEVDAVFEDNTRAGIVAHLRRKFRRAGDR